MRRELCAALVVAGLAVSSAANADTVSVPCEEFVQITGKRLACDKMPVLKMPREKWDKEKAAAQGRASADSDLPPWERSGKTSVKPQQKTIAETNPCSVPPWERPSGTKCN